MTKEESINMELKKLFENTSFEDYEYEDFETADELIDNFRERILEEEVIYYTRAIDYLKENDASLHESMELANNMGYEVKNLNSEILATLLQQDNLNAELNDLIDEIENIFNSHE